MESLQPRASTLAISCSKRSDHTLMQPLKMVVTWQPTLSLLMLTISATLTLMWCPKEPLSLRRSGTLRILKHSPLHARTISMLTPSSTLGLIQLIHFPRSLSARFATSIISFSHRLRRNSAPAWLSTWASATSPVSTSSSMRKDRKTTKTASTRKSSATLTNGLQVSRGSMLHSRTGIRQRWSMRVVTQALQWRTAAPILRSAWPQAPAQPAMAAPSPSLVSTRSMKSIWTISSPLHSRLRPRICSTSYMRLIWP